MSMEYTGITYFPLNANFFEEEVTELLEAKFGMQASYIVVRLLCKIYKEGYFISWGKDQCIIFLRKSGGEIQEDIMNKIINFLLEKNFFNREYYEKYSILTSENIQKVWLEATSRRKRDLTKLPYLLTTIGGHQVGNGKQNEDLDKKTANNLPTQGELNLRNADNSEQSKEEKSKVLEEEEELREFSIEIPQYAYNQTTHNLAGLIDSMKQYKVTDPKELQTILRLSDYGRKGTTVWKLFPNTNWGKITTPGKFIISALVKESKHGN